MIKVHHVPRSRSVRVIWLLEELGLPYEVEQREFTIAALKDPAYMKIHPLGLTPAAEIDGLTMIESGAILEYILERHGQGRLAPPPGTPERGVYLQWFHYGEATLARYVSDIVRNRFGLSEANRCPEFVPFARTRFYEVVGPVEAVLGTRPYIAGDAFSAADIMIMYGLVMSKIVREFPEGLPNITAYLGRLKERPAYAKAWA